jgi:hypothetical protein
MSDMFTCTCGQEIRLNTSTNTWINVFGYATVGDHWHAPAVWETGPKLTAVLTEARGWLSDCEWRDDITPEDIAAMPDAKIKRAVALNYEGGWDAFVMACIDL